MDGHRAGVVGEGGAGSTAGVAVRGRVGRRWSGVNAVGAEPELRGLEMKIVWAGRK